MISWYVIIKPNISIATSGCLGQHRLVLMIRPHLFKWEIRSSNHQGGTLYHKFHQTFGLWFTRLSGSSLSDFRALVYQTFKLWFFYQTFELWGHSVILRKKKKKLSDIHQKKTSGCLDLNTAHMMPHACNARVWKTFLFSFFFLGVGWGGLVS